jgi:hypothetical protein
MVTTLLMASSYSNGCPIVAPVPKQIESNHMGIGPGNEKGDPTPPILRPTASFVHNDGSGVLHCPGTK